MRTRTATTTASPRKRRRTRITSAWGERTAQLQAADETICEQRERVAYLENEVLVLTQHRDMLETDRAKLLGENEALRKRAADAEYREDNQRADKESAQTHAKALAQQIVTLHARVEERERAVLALGLIVSELRLKVRTVTP